MIECGCLQFTGKEAEIAFKNLRNRYSRDKKKVHSAQVSGTDTQSVVAAKQQTGELYSFLAWLEPYIQPRRSSTNLVVVDGKDTCSDAPDEESTDVENDRMSTRSSTPEPDPLYKSKVTGRPKYLHAKRPKPADRVGIEGSEIEFLKTIGEHLVNKDSHKEVRDEESLFGDLIASQLRKMPDHDRLVTKMEINNLIYSRLMKASSQEAIDNTGYAATRYPEVANRVYSERQSITPQGAANPLRLLSDLGNAENTHTFPPGYFFEQRHERF